MSVKIPHDGPPLFGPRSYFTTPKHERVDWGSTSPVTVEQYLAIIANGGTYSTPLGLIPDALGDPNLACAPTMDEYLNDYRPEHPRLAVNAAPWRGRFEDDPDVLCAPTMAEYLNDYRPEHPRMAVNSAPWQGRFEDDPDLPCAPTSWD